MLWLLAIAIPIFPQVGASGSTSKRRLEGSSWASGGNWWAAVEPMAFSVQKTMESQHFQWVNQ
jgi:hypothetical protein